MDYTNPLYIPKPAELASYLRENRPNDRERDVLLAWYAAPDHIARTQEIADALGLTMLQVNNAYGRLGRRVVTALNVPLPEEALPSHVFASFKKLDDGYWYSFMHDRVAQAIELMGWDEEARRKFAGFYEATDDAPAPGRRYLEGRLKEARVIARARSGRARQECIDHHGLACVACGFDFEAVYGERGREFIEVHHLNPMASVDAEYEIDPKEDLRPVCSNCHRMIHREADTLSIEELREMIARPVRR